MRIGVLGGSFDPPQLAHAGLAALAERELQLDLVLWLVAGDQWQKQVTTPAAIRAHLVELAIAGHRNWQVSNVDIDRAGPTYTVESLADLRTSWPEADLVFLLGADAVAGLASWHRAADLAAMCEFAAVARAGHRAEVPTGFRVHWLSGVVPDVSSTQVRERVQAGADAAELVGLVHPAVAEYILEVGLYK